MNLRKNVAEKGKKIKCAKCFCPKKKEKEFSFFSSRTFKVRNRRRFHLPDKSISDYEFKNHILFKLQTDAENHSP